VTDASGRRSGILGWSLDSYKIQEAQARACMGDVKGACDTLEALLAARPDLVNARAHLAVWLGQLGRPSAAIEHLARFLEAKPGVAEAHRDLGLALLAVGREDEGVERLLRFPCGPAARWKEDVGTMRRLAADRAGILSGERPVSAREGVLFGYLASRSGLLQAAGRFYVDAVDADTALAEEIAPVSGTWSWRALAANAAAVAAAGVGADAGTPHERPAAEWRAVALRLLAADADRWERDLASADPALRRRARSALGLWREGLSFAFVRFPYSLERLPEPEARAFRALWARVDALLAAPGGE
jgi:tetratricopeptide (TPR) repeat protein